MSQGTDMRLCKVSFFLPITANLGPSRILVLYGALLATHHIFKMRSMPSPNMSLVLSVSHRSKMAPPPSSQDWEEKRGLICQLYLYDGWTLSKVREHMRKAHGFDAT